MLTNLYTPSFLDPSSAVGAPVSAIPQTALAQPPPVLSLQPGGASLPPPSQDQVPPISGHPDLHFDSGPTATESYLNAVTPQHYDMGVQFSQNPDVSSAVAPMLMAAIGGQHPDDYQAGLAKSDQDSALNSAMNSILESTKGNEQLFKDTLARLNGLTPPTPPTVPQLQQPNFLQAGLAGLGAVLDPWHAAQNASAPFQSALQQQDLGFKRATETFGMQNQVYSEQLQQLEHMAQMASQAKEAGLNHLASLLQHQASMTALQLNRQAMNYDRDSRAFNVAWANPRASVDELKALTRRYPQMGLNESDALRQWQQVHAPEAAKQYETELQKYRNWAGFLDDNAVSRFKTMKQGLMDKYGLTDSELEEPVSEAGMRKQMADQNLAEFTQRFGLSQQRLTDQEQNHLDLMANSKANRDLQAQKLKVLQGHLQVAQGELAQRQAFDAWKQQAESFNRAEKQYDDVISNAVKVGRFKQHEESLRGDEIEQADIPDLDPPEVPQPATQESGVSPFNLGVGGIGLEGPVGGHAYTLPNVQPGTGPTRTPSLPPLNFQTPRGADPQDPEILRIAQDAIARYNHRANPDLKGKFEATANAAIQRYWLAKLKQPINHAG